MKRIVGILLLVLAVYLAYMGIAFYQESTANVDLLGINVEASDKQGKETAIIYIVSSIVCGIIGFLLMRRPR